MLFSNYFYILSSPPHTHTEVVVRNFNGLPQTDRIGFWLVKNECQPSSIVSVGNFGLGFQTSIVQADWQKAACGYK